MSDHIVHILPEQVASQIAAGEVVERPASAVKELVENSLDAGARSVSVEILGGGSALIAVADDGSGMTRADAILSLRRHATSKIRSAADLTAIRTLGFRGEALASIASVSHLRMQTRRAEDEHGVEVAAEAGNIEDTRTCAIAAGTRIEVRELFFNTPARLKFLKTLATEQGAIAESFQRVALANHHIAFRLSADGRVVFDLPRANSVLERFRQVFGPKIATKMLAFDLDRPGIRAQGLAASSQESFATGRMIFTFVNGRSVRDRMLIRAVEQVLPDADSARTSSGDAAVRRYAARRGRRQRASDENRGAISQWRRGFRRRLSCDSRPVGGPDRKCAGAGVIHRRCRDGTDHNVVGDRELSRRRRGSESAQRRVPCGWCPMRPARSRISVRSPSLTIATRARA